GANNQRSAAGSWRRYRRGQKLEASCDHRRMGGPAMKENKASPTGLLTFKRHGQPETNGEPLHYTASGLDDVYLLNGFKRETIDGEDYVTIEDLDGLWKAIGLHLARTRKDLAPKQIRFLRHHMNLTQA